MCRAFPAPTVNLWCNGYLSYIDTDRQRAMEESFVSLTWVETLCCYPTFTCGNKLIFESGRICLWRWWIGGQDGGDAEKMADRQIMCQWKLEGVMREKNCLRFQHLSRPVCAVWYTQSRPLNAQSSLLFQWTPLLSFLSPLPTTPCEISSQLTNSCNVATATLVDKIRLDLEEKNEALRRDFAFSGRPWTLGLLRCVFSLLLEIYTA